MSSQETRDRIVACSLKLFAERGFDGATTALIAREAGVAEGTIYRHFKDKKELFLASLAPMVERAMEQGFAEIQEASSLEAMVGTMIRTRIRVIEENMDAFNVLFSEARFHPELPSMLVQRVFATRPDLSRVLQQKLHGHPDLARTPNFGILGLGMTVMIWGLFLVRGHLGAGIPLPFPVSFENLETELTEFALYGIAGRKPGGESPS